MVARAMPYLSLRLALVGSVMLEAGHAEPRDHTDTRAIDISLLDANLLDAFVRLTRLLPPITREIIYRLLVGSVTWQS
jgi:hypothetical protein